MSEGEAVKPMADLEVMEEVGCDLFDFEGHSYLVLVDRKSSFPLWKRMSKGHQGTREVATTLTDWFRVFGWCVKLRSDGGSQFRKRFDDFCTAHHIVHELSAAYHPQSNGLAEGAVGRVKNVIMKAVLAREDIGVAVQEFRNTPMSEGPPPATVFFKRHLRGEVPHLRSPVDMADLAKERQCQREKFLTSRPGVRYEPLEVGQKVWLKDRSSGRWNVKATIDKVRSHRRSYWITTEEGTSLLRNRVLLKPRLGGGLGRDIGDIGVIADSESSESGVSDELSSAGVSNHVAIPPITTCQSARIKQRENTVKQAVYNVHDVLGAGGGAGHGRGGGGMGLQLQREGSRRQGGRLKIRKQ